MSKSINEKYDNVDDRKEIYNILQNHMDERLRCQFLIWCCRQVSTDLSKVLRPGIKSTWHPKEVYWQIMSLSFMHGLNLDLATKKIEEVARTGKIF